MQAAMLEPPSAIELSLPLQEPDVVRLHAARAELRQQLATYLRAELCSLLCRCDKALAAGAGSLDGPSAGASWFACTPAKLRAARGAVLSALSFLPSEQLFVRQLYNRCGIGAVCCCVCRWLGS